MSIKLYHGRSFEVFLSQCRQCYKARCFTSTECCY